MEIRCAIGVDIVIEIKEYAEQYAGEMSKIILDNMYTINVKDHGQDVSSIASGAMIT